MYYLREPLFVFEITDRFATHRNIGKELRDEIEVIVLQIPRPLRIPSESGTWSSAPQIQG